MCPRVAPRSANLPTTVIRSPIASTSLRRDGTVRQLIEVGDKIFSRMGMMINDNGATKRPAKDYSPRIGKIIPIPNESVRLSTKLVTLVSRISLQSTLTSHWESTR